MRLMTRVTVAAVALLALAIGTASAVPPEAPVGIRGWVGQNHAGPVINLVWSFSPNGPDSTRTHDGSHLYVGVAELGAITFRLLASVPDSANMPGTAYYSMPVNAQGRYYFYAAGYNGDGEGAASDTIYVDYPTQVQVRFSSTQYIDSANTGEEYLRYFVAQGPANGTIRYSLVNNGGNGASFDSVTGKFTWTPGNAGAFTFALRATVVEDPSNTASATLVLIVNGPDTNWTVRFSGGNRSRTLLVGQTLRDSVFAYARDGGSVWYDLENEPAAMTIDQNGVIDWVGPSPGTYTFRVVAGKTGETQPAASINYTIRVSDTVNYVSIMGWVTDSIRQAYVHATVYLYRQVPGTVSYQLFDSMVATQGYYSFRGVSNGNYILQAVPVDTIYVPGYFVRNGLAAGSWQNATVISVGPNSWGDSAEIRLPWANGYHGSNRLDGSVVGNAGSIKQGTDHSLSGLSPVSGATVYVIDDMGHVSGYDRTDAEGDYTIYGIGAGMYNILIDKIGYQPMTKTVTFAEDNGTTETVPVELQSVGSGSSVPVDRIISASLELIPNPARTTLRVGFEGNGKRVVVRLIDNIGREVMARTVETNVGATSLELPMSKLSSGRYLITIAGADGVAAAPVVVLGQ